MRLVCISDTHSAHRAISLPEGDVLIHAGDATGRGGLDEVASFLFWFSAQPHSHKILIAGNHDWLFQKYPGIANQLLAESPDITYLQDSGAEIGGVKFWGSPWQPWHLDWAFNLPRNGRQIREAWELIPIETDVLITHGPPHGILDQNYRSDHVGCEALARRLVLVRPRLHVFGHIHSSYGMTQSGATTYINASVCVGVARTLNKPIVVDLTLEGVNVHPDSPDFPSHPMAGTP